MIILEILKTILIGIIEGITEWLPVSSTGHMILFDNFVQLDLTDAFKELFLVVIQLGAILAVAVLYFDKLNPFSKKKSDDEKKKTWRLWGKVIVGALPAAIVGFLLDDIINDYLFGYVTVAIALVVYGVAFILIEKWRAGKPYRVESVDDISYTDALLIGGFQILSLIPGTSRSGSTILGGMLTGVSRTASAEFSFFMAIPIMLGASGLKILKLVYSGYTVTSFELLLLLIGIAVAFLVSIAVIDFLMRFVKEHSLRAFGIYRILLGAAVLLYFL